MRDSFDVFSKIQDSERTTVSRSAETTRIIYYGEVVENEDPQSRGRLRVFIPELDQAFANKKNQLAWCSYFFATNIQHIPKVGERVAIILENPWKKDHGRWWVGPVLEEGIVAVPLDSVALSARDNNSIELTDSGDVKLTTDKTKDRLQAEVTIILDKENESLRMSARDIVLESTVNAGGTEYSVPYGERLVELLRFILQTMKTHSHPPNSPPTPDFFVQADRYLRQLDEWLINKNIRTRGE